MKSNQIKRILLSIFIVLIFVIVWLSIHGINKTVEKTVSLEVYEDNDWIPDKDSSVTIKGNFRKTLFSSSFVGTFAIEYYESSCREGTEAKIEWHDGYQLISYYHEGNSSADLTINIDEDMRNMMIVLNDKTIITSLDYDIPTEIWKHYKG